MKNYCNSFCSHGGVCVLDPGHEELHDSKYCTWSDMEAITREEADQILHDAGKSEVVTLWNTLGL